MEMIILIPPPDHPLFLFVRIAVLNKCCNYGSQKISKVLL